MRFRSRNAFTLVELLVVIGIIAVLLAIFLPALAKARDSANQTKCMSNLRQISAAFVMYAQSNRGCFPFASFLGNPGSDDLIEDWIHWRTSAAAGGLRSSAVAPYLSNQEAVLQQVFRCPSDSLDRVQINLSMHGPYRYSYSMNVYMDPRLVVGPGPIKRFVGTRFGTIRNASEKTLVLEESAATINDGLWWPGYYSAQTWIIGFPDRLGIRHDSLADDFRPSTPGKVADPDKRGNVAFCDGHVEFITRRFVHDPIHILPNE